MIMNKHFAAAGIPILCAGLTLTVAMLAWAQQGVPAQVPQPSNPLPRPEPTPQGTPSEGPRPVPQGIQGQPSEGPRADPKGIPPVVPLDPKASINAAAAGAAGVRSARPFVFQSPESEARFSESTRRLVTMEQKLDQSNQDLLKRLGQARTLTGEHQNAALFDVLQQMLRDNSELHRYLGQSRLAWTGDEAAQSAAVDGQPASAQTPPAPTAPAAPIPQRR